MVGPILQMHPEGIRFWYPTSTLVTGFDIIFFWVARMIMAGLELFGDDAPDLSDEEIVKRIPFKNVFIHGLIRDDRVVRCLNL